MELYLAPLEGITTYTFRNIIHDLFGDGISKYYTPFIVPRPKKGMQDKERAGLLPENNPGIRLVPQILTNDPQAFVELAEEIFDKYAWEEINLNAGCPSGTVTVHNKGAGMLKDIEALDRFLDYVFSHAKQKISVKTRIGIEDPAEWERILAVYEKYPIYELTVHPRILTQMYKPPVYREILMQYSGSSCFPIVYNGDIFTVEDYKWAEACGEDKIKAVMLGRGILRDPALAREINGGASVTREEIQQYLRRVYEDYRSLYGGDDATVLYRMKELWFYLSELFPGKEAALKELRKARDRESYREAERAILM